MQLKKNQVIQIAKELFAEQGVNESSVQDIINKGNISKGTFYNYFSSRNEFLIAYLEAARHEEMSRRNHLEQLDNLSEQEIFSKQINTRLKINREFTLFPIFEIARQSKGPLLKNYMKDSFLDELQWLIKRLVHLYGEEVRLYAAEGAIFLYGMIHNMLHTLTLITENEIDTDSLVSYIMRRLDQMIKDMIQTQDSFLMKNNIRFFTDQEDTLTKEMIVADLRHFLTQIDGNHTELTELVLFFIEEMGAQHPRYTILKSLLMPFREFRKQSPLKKDIDTLYYELTLFIDCHNEKTAH